MVQAGSKADHPVPGRPKSIVMKESRGSDPTCRSEWQEVLGVMPFIVSTTLTVNKDR